MSLLYDCKQLIKRQLTAAAKRWNERVEPLPPSEWALQTGPDGTLALEGLSLSGLAERWGSPLHVVHAEALRRNVNAFQSAAGGEPACEVYYSYKTNPIPAVLRLMHSMGVGAEVISEYELWLAFRLGVPPEKIIYNGPVKSEASLREAIFRGILLINANHREEIARLGRLSTELGKRPRVGVRVTADGGWTGQFGCSIGTGEALEAVQEAAQHPALELCALHAHLGAPIRSEAQVTSFVTQILEFAEEAQKATGFALELLDLGGSLAIPTVQSFNATERRLNMTLLAELAPPDPKSMLAISDYVHTIGRLVTEHCRKYGRPRPRVLLEPGRAMTGNTQLLVTSVQTIKESKNGPPFAILDAGINLAQSVQSEYHQVMAVAAPDGRSKRTYRLAGPICSPGDVLYWACALPELRPGDKLAIVDAGAYFVPFANSFSFPQPAIVMVDDGRDTLIRRAETFEDLITCDVGP